MKVKDIVKVLSANISNEDIDYIDNEVAYGKVHFELTFTRADNNFVWNDTWTADCKGSVYGYKHEDDRWYTSNGDPGEPGYTDWDNIRWYDASDIDLVDSDIDSESYDWIENSDSWDDIYDLAEEAINNCIENDGKYEMKESLEIETDKRPEIIHVNSKEELKELEKASALTIEGLNPEDAEAFHTWVLNQGATTDGKVYIISGKFMNDSYGLTGDNAYPDDLTIVSIKFNSLGKLIITRFQIGARWFDDIVANNRSREQDLNESKMNEAFTKKENEITFPGDDLHSRMCEWLYSTADYYDLKDACEVDENPEDKTWEMSDEELVNAIQYAIDNEKELWYVYTDDDPKTSPAREDGEALINEYYSKELHESKMKESDEMTSYLKDNGDDIPLQGTEVLIKAPSGEVVVAECIDEDEYLFRDLSTGDEFPVSYRKIHLFNDDEDDITEFKSRYYPELLDLFESKKSKMKEFNPHGRYTNRKKPETVPEKILRLLDENDNKLSMDGGERFYTVVRLNTDEVEMNEQFENQLRRQGLYSLAWCSAIISDSDRDKKVSMNALPIFGRSDRYETKWFHLSKLGCIQEDVKNRSMHLSKRIDILNPVKMTESLVTTNVVFEPGTRTIVGLCKDLKTAQLKAGSYNAYTNSNRFVGIPFTNIRNSEYTFSKYLLDQICDKFAESKLNEYTKDDCIDILDDEYVKAVKLENYARKIGNSGIMASAGGRAAAFGDAKEYVKKIDALATDKYEQFVNEHKYNESKEYDDEESKSFIKRAIAGDKKFGYQLLSRMKSDCDYVLGSCQSYGKNKGALHHLWVSGDPENHIAAMRFIYNLLDEKPEWLTEEDIDNYEKALEELAR